MTRRATMLTTARCAAVAFLALAGASIAGAQTPEPRSMESYGADHLNCAEWSDGCTVCRRDDTGQGRCSTPGIACQPSQTVCRTTKP